MNTTCSSCGKEFQSGGKIVFHSTNPNRGAVVCGDCAPVINDDFIEARNMASWQRRNKTVDGWATPVNGL